MIPTIAKTRFQPIFNIFQSVEGRAKYRKIKKKINELAGLMPSHVLAYLDILIMDDHGSVEHI